MTYSQPETVEQAVVESYSRSARRVNESNSHRKVSKRSRIASGHKLLIFILSVLTGCLSIAMPFLVGLASSVQSENLYIGLMFTKGILPYTNLFATGGFLYYVLIAVAYLLGSTLWLIPIQIFAFYTSGIYLYKIINHFTDNPKIANTFTLIFFLLNLGLGFGGLYPIQFAMPFILVSLWFLVKYFTASVKDEAFIIYGFAGATAMLIEPRSFVFWAFSLLGILIFNIRQKHVARGIYQWLCIFFGIILILYTAAYFILNFELLSNYIAQAIVYSLSYYTTTTANLGLTIVYQLVVGLLSGLLLGAVSIYTIIKTSSDKFVKGLIFTVFLAFLLIDLLSQSYQLYHLLSLLPFALILTVLVVNVWQQKIVSAVSHRRRKIDNSGKGAFCLFMGRHLYMPIVIIILGIGYPVTRYFFYSSLNAERQTIASYLEKNVDSDSSIYVWDDTASIYLKTGLKSSSQFALPLVNTNKDSNYKDLEDEILQNKASYIVVNNGMELSSTIENNLTSNYTEVKIDDISGFTIYQKNN